MSRVPGPGRRRGPGFTAFPRHGVLRVNDLVAPAVDPAVVRAALAAHGVPEVDRDEPVGRSVRAVITPTPAGILVTLEARGGLRTPRPVVLRRLTRMWETIAAGLVDGSRDPCNPGRTRT